MSSEYGSKSRYVLISADGHAGADIDDYKPYLERSFHSEFDVWRRSFKDGWSYLDQMPDATRSIDDDMLHCGAASFLSPVNWDSALRQRHVEADGIAAEVFYANTVPPFYPSGSITAAGPVTRLEYERREAGLRAHNRWLVDFCAELPGRRAGMAQIFVDDLDDTLKDVAWARRAGLSGVAMPADHFRKLHQLFRPEYDRLWAVLQDLDMPMGFHSILPSDVASEESGFASGAIGVFENGAMMQRAMSSLILGGVFERFPGLQAVVTEQQCAWIPASLQAMDRFWAAAHAPKNFAYILAADAMKALPRQPSEYFRSNYYVASFLGPFDTAVIDELGYERIMWGADFPHHEGSYPYSVEALRANFAGRPEPEVRAMTSTTAADVFGFDLGLLQKVADRIGPEPAVVASPLASVDFPSDSMTPAFGIAASPAAYAEVAKR